MIGMLDSEDLKKLMSAATQSLEMNKKFFADLKAHQELICDFSKFLVKLSHVQNLPISVLFQVAEMSNKIVDFQKSFVGEVETWKEK